MLANLIAASSFRLTLLSIIVIGFSQSITNASIGRKHAVIVGGGPIGLMAALTLSNQPHFYNVTLLEKTFDESSVLNYDPSRAYMYHVNGRGLQVLDKFPNLLEKLKTRGVTPKEGMGSIQYVPATPHEPLPGRVEARPGLSGKDLKGEGQPRATPKGQTEKSNTATRPGIWIPRHQMVQLLLESCQEQENARLNSKNHAGQINILTGKTFTNLEPLPDHSLCVQCDDGTSLEAALVVAADGIDSDVRKCLADTSQSTWLQSRADMFKVLKYKSPSTRLRMKSLQFPPDFTISESDGTEAATEAEKIYIFRSVNKGRETYLSLGMLPMKDPRMIRPANINTRPDHIVWTIKDGRQMKEWFKRSFPRVDFDKWISDAEWDRFAKAEGTTYPHCQYSRGSAMTSPSQETGVVMIGDACHAFPPDIGQGINAGLQDVQALDRALSGVDISSGQLAKLPPSTLSEALTRYEKNRRAEHHALIRLARFGAPYQYKQPWIRDRIGRQLWIANVALRALLSKLTLGLFPPAAIVLAQDSSLSFRQVMRRADIAVLVLRTIFIAVAVRLFVKVVT